MVRKYVVLLMRIIQFGIGLSLGIFALFWTAPEMKRLNASVTQREQLLAAGIFAIAYLGVAAFAIRDVRASSLLANVVALLSTPLYALVWLLSAGWDKHGESMPLLWGIGANIVLFCAGITGFVLSRQPRSVAVVPENK